MREFLLESSIVVIVLISFLAVMSKSDSLELWSFIVGAVQCIAVITPVHYYLAFAWLIWTRYNYVFHYLSCIELGYALRLEHRLLPETMLRTISLSRHVYPEQ